ncbi:MAG: hypothetical protein MMC33_010853 [Icmadophila ericetorum]|nr:hypothetical protein [Icmadophila ericetorum]
MGYTKRTLQPGNEITRPVTGDEIGVYYTGWIYDESNYENDHKGKQFDTSIGRGVFKITIGEGKVIKGWDEGVMEMSLGEKAIFTISEDYAYGNHGFPGIIPPNSALVFEIQLLSVNDTRYGKGNGDGKDTGLEKDKDPQLVKAK